MTTPTEGMVLGVGWLMAHKLAKGGKDAFVGVVDDSVVLPEIETCKSFSKIVDGPKATRQTDPLMLKLVRSGVQSCRNFARTTLLTGAMTLRARV